MPNFKATIYGLDEIKEYINPNRINRELAKGVGSAVKELHATLAHSVFEKYNIKRTLDTVLIGKSISNVTFGKNQISSGLEYRHESTYLSDYVTDVFDGNIKAEAKRPGRVHVVTVIRGRPRIVRGKSGNGGFIPKGWSRPMFERVGQGKYPLRLLYGMSLSQMAETVFTYDPKVQRAIDQIENLILEKFIP